MDNFNDAINALIGLALMTAFCIGRNNKKWVKIMMISNTVLFIISILICNILSSYKMKSQSDIFSTVILIITAIIVLVYLFSEVKRWIISNFCDSKPKRKCKVKKH